MDILNFLTHLYQTPDWSGPSDGSQESLRQAQENFVNNYTPATVQVSTQATANVAQAFQRQFGTTTQNNQNWSAFQTLLSGARTQRTEALARISTAHSLNNEATRGGAIEEILAVNDRVLGSSFLMVESALNENPRNLDHIRSALTSYNENVQAYTRNLNMLGNAGANSSMLPTATLVNSYSYIIRPTLALINLLQSRLARAEHADPVLSQQIKTLTERVRDVWSLIANVIQSNPSEMQNFQFLREFALGQVDLLNLGLAENGSHPELLTSGREHLTQAFQQSQGIQNPEGDLANFIQVVQAYSARHVNNLQAPPTVQEAARSIISSNTLAFTSTIMQEIDLSHRASEPQVAERYTRYQMVMNTLLALHPEQNLRQSMDQLRTLRWNDALYNEAQTWVQDHNAHLPAGTSPIQFNDILQALTQENNPLRPEIMEKANTYNRSNGHGSAGGSVNTENINAPENGLLTLLRGSQTLHRLLPVLASAYREAITHIPEGSADRSLLIQYLTGINVQQLELQYGLEAGKREILVALFSNRAPSAEALNLFRQSGPRARAFVDNLRLFMRALPTRATNVAECTRLMRMLQVNQALNQGGAVNNALTSLIPGATPQLGEIPASLTTPPTWFHELETAQYSNNPNAAENNAAQEVLAGLNQVIDQYQANTLLGERDSEAIYNRYNGHLINFVTNARNNDLRHIDDMLRDGGMFDDDHEVLDELLNANTAALSPQNLRSASQLGSVVNSWSQNVLNILDDHTRDYGEAFLHDNEEHLGSFRVIWGMIAGQGDGSLSHQLSEIHLPNSNLASENISRARTQMGRANSWGPWVSAFESWASPENLAFTGLMAGTSQAANRFIQGERVVAAGGRVTLTRFLEASALRAQQWVRFVNLIRYPLQGAAATSRWLGTHPGTSTFLFSLAAGGSLTGVRNQAAHLHNLSHPDDLQEEPGLEDALGTTASLFYAGTLLRYPSYFASARNVEMPALYSPSGWRNIVFAPRNWHPLARQALTGTLIGGAGFANMRLHRNDPAHSHAYYMGEGALYMLPFALPFAGSTSSRFTNLIENRTWGRLTNEGTLGMATVAENGQLGVTGHALVAGFSGLGSGAVAAGITALRDGRAGENTHFVGDTAQSALTLTLAMALNALGGFTYGRLRQGISRNTGTEAEILAHNNANAGTQLQTLIQQTNRQLAVRGLGRAAGGALFATIGMLAAESEVRALQNHRRFPTEASDRHFSYEEMAMSYVNMLTFEGMNAGMSRIQIRSSLGRPRATQIDGIVNRLFLGTDVATNTPETRNLVWNRLAIESLRGTDLSRMASNDVVQNWRARVDQGRILLEGLTTPSTVPEGHLTQALVNTAAARALVAGNSNMPPAVALYVNITDGTIHTQIENTDAARSAHQAVDLEFSGNRISLSDRTQRQLRTLSGDASVSLQARESYNVILARQGSEIQIPSAAVLVNGVIQGIRAEQSAVRRSVFVVETDRANQNCTSAQEVHRLLNAERAKTNPNPETVQHLQRQQDLFANRILLGRVELDGNHYDVYNGPREQMTDALLRDIYGRRYRPNTAIAPSDQDLINNRTVAEVVIPGSNDRVLTNTTAASIPGNWLTNPRQHWNARNTASDLSTEPVSVRSLRGNGAWVEVPEAWRNLFANLSHPERVSVDHNRSNLSMGVFKDGNLYCDVGQTLRLNANSMNTPFGAQMRDGFEMGLERTGENTWRVHNFSTQEITINAGGHDMARGTVADFQSGDVIEIPAVANNDGTARDPLRITLHTDAPTPRPAPVVTPPVVTPPVVTPPVVTPPVVTPPVVTPPVVTPPVVTPPVVTPPVVTPPVVTPPVVTPPVVTPPVTRTPTIPPPPRTSAAPSPTQITYWLEGNNVVLEDGTRISVSGRMSGPRINNALREHLRPTRGDNVDDADCFRFAPADSSRAVPVAAPISRGPLPRPIPASGVALTLHTQGDAALQAMSGQVQINFGPVSARRVYVLPAMNEGDTLALTHHEAPELITNDQAQLRIKRVGNDYELTVVDPSDPMSGVDNESITPNMSYNVGHTGFRIEVPSVRTFSTSSSSSMAAPMRQASGNTTQLGGLDSSVIRAVSDFLGPLPRSGVTKLILCEMIPNSTRGIVRIEEVSEHAIGSAPPTLQANQILVRVGGSAEPSLERTGNLDALSTEARNTLAQIVHASPSDSSPTGVFDSPPLAEAILILDRSLVLQGLFPSSIPAATYSVMGTGEAADPFRVASVDPGFRGPRLATVEIPAASDQNVIIRTSQSQNSSSISALIDALQKNFPGRVHVEEVVIPPVPPLRGSPGGGGSFSPDPTAAGLGSSTSAALTPSIATHPSLHIGVNNLITSEVPLAHFYPGERDLPPIEFSVQHHASGSFLRVRSVDGSGQVSFRHPLSADPNPTRVGQDWVSMGKADDVTLRLNFTNTRGEAREVQVNINNSHTEARTSTPPPPLPQGVSTFVFTRGERRTLADVLGITEPTSQLHNVHVRLAASGADSYYLDTGDNVHRISFTRSNAATFDLTENRNGMLFGNPGETIILTVQDSFGNSQTHPVRLPNPREASSLPPSGGRGNFPPEPAPVAPEEVNAGAPDLHPHLAYPARVGEVPGTDVLGQHGILRINSQSIDPAHRGPILIIAENSAYQLPEIQQGNGLLLSNEVLHALFGNSTPENMELHLRHRHDGEYSLEIQEGPSTRGHISRNSTLIFNLNYSGIPESRAIFRLPQLVAAVSPARTEQTPVPGTLATPPPVSAVSDTPVGTNLQTGPRIRNFNEVRGENRRVYGITHSEDPQEISEVKRLIDEAYASGARSIGLEISQELLDHPRHFNIFSEYAEHARSRGMTVIPLEQEANRFTRIRIDQSRQFIDETGNFDSTRLDAEIADLRRQHRRSAFSPPEITGPIEFNLNFSEALKGVLESVGYDLDRYAQLWQQTIQVQTDAEMLAAIQTRNPDVVFIGGQHARGLQSRVTSHQVVDLAGIITDSSLHPIYPDPSVYSQIVNAMRILNAHSEQFFYQDFREAYQNQTGQTISEAQLFEILDRMCTADPTLPHVVLRAHQRDIIPLPENIQFLRLPVSEAQRRLREIISSVSTSVSVTTPVSGTTVLAASVPPRPRLQSVNVFSLSDVSNFFAQVSGNHSIVFLLQNLRSTGGRPPQIHPNELGLLQHVEVSQEGNTYTFRPPRDFVIAVHVEESPNVWTAYEGRHDNPVILNRITPETKIFISGFDPSTGNLSQNQVCFLHPTSAVSDTPVSGSEARVSTPPVTAAIAPLVLDTTVSATRVSLPTSHDGTPAVSTPSAIVPELVRAPEAILPTTRVRQDVAEYRIPIAGSVSLSRGTNESLANLLRAQGLTLAENSFLDHVSVGRELRGNNQPYLFRTDGDVQFTLTRQRLAGSLPYGNDAGNYSGFPHVLGEPGETVVIQSGTEAYTLTLQAPESGRSSAPQRSFGNSFWWNGYQGPGLFSRAANYLERTWADINSSRDARSRVSTTAPTQRPRNDVRVEMPVIVAGIPASITHPVPDQVNLNFTTNAAGEQECIVGRTRNATSPIVNLGSRVIAREQTRIIRVGDRYFIEDLSNNPVLASPVANMFDRGTFVRLDSNGSSQWHRLPFQNNNHERVRAPLNTGNIVAFGFPRSGMEFYRFQLGTDGSPHLQRIESDALSFPSSSLIPNYTPPTPLIERLVQPGGTPSVISTSAAVDLNALHETAFESPQVYDAEGNLIPVPLTQVGRGINFGGGQSRIGMSVNSGGPNGEIQPVYYLHDGNFVPTMDGNNNPLPTQRVPQASALGTWLQRMDGALFRVGSRTNEHDGIIDLQHGDRIFFGPPENPSHFFDWVSPLEDPVSFTRRPDPRLTSSTSLAANTSLTRVTALSVAGTATYDIYGSGTVGNTHIYTVAETSESAALCRTDAIPHRYRIASSRALSVAELEEMHYHRQQPADAQIHEIYIDRSTQFGTPLPGETMDVYLTRHVSLESNFSVTAGRNVLLIEDPSFTGTNPVKVAEIRNQNDQISIHETEGSHPVNYAFYDSAGGHHEGRIQNGHDLEAGHYIQIGSQMFHFPDVSGTGSLPYFVTPRNNALNFLVADPIRLSVSSQEPVRSTLHDEAATQSTVRPAQDTITFASMPHVPSPEVAPVGVAPHSNQPVSLVPVESERAPEALLPVRSVPLPTFPVPDLYASRRPLVDFHLPTLFDFFERTRGRPSNPGSLLREWQRTNPTGAPTTPSNDMGRIEEVSIQRSGDSYTFTPPRNLHVAIHLEFRNGSNTGTSNHQASLEDPATLSVRPGDRVWVSLFDPTTGRLGDRSISFTYPRVH